MDGLFVLHPGMVTYYSSKNAWFHGSAGLPPGSQAGTWRSGTR